MFVHFFCFSKRNEPKKRTPSCRFCPALGRTRSGPGNLRELQNTIKRAVALGSSGIIYAEDLGIPEIEGQLADRGWQGESSSEEKLLTLKEARTRAEIDAISRALAATGNNISQAAKILEISRPTLHDLIRKHGLKG